MIRKTQIIIILTIICKEYLFFFTKEACFVKIDQISLQMSKNKEGLKPLPLDCDVESKSVLKSLPAAHAALAELKGIASSMPNQSILINTLGLQEAKDSSAIENIITTHDDLYKSELNLDSFTSLNAKEV
jgi:hypothetical protein